MEKNSLNYIKIFYLCCFDNKIQKKSKKRKIQKKSATEVKKSKISCFFPVISAIFGKISFTQII